MSREGSTVSVPRSVAVLDSALTWTHDCLEAARASPLGAATPCAGWDLARLLAHMDESLTAVAEAAELGCVAVDVVPDPPDAGRLVDRVVQRACRTRAAWSQRLTSAPIGVGELVLGRDSLVLVAALEIAVHGWDVARTCAGEDDLPEDLAARLYPVALAVVVPDERTRRFAAALEVPASASYSTRLLAHLGRNPAWPGPRPGGCA